MAQSKSDLLKEIKKLQEEINTLESKSVSLTDSEIKKRDQLSKKIIQNARELKKINTEQLRTESERLNTLSDMESSLARSAETAKNYQKPMIDIERQRLELLSNSNIKSEHNLEVLSNLADLNQRLSQLGSDDLIQRQAINAEFELEAGKLRGRGAALDEQVRLLKQSNDLANQYAGLTEKQQEFLENQISVYNGIQDAIGGVLETASLLTSTWGGRLGAVTIGAGMLVDKITDVNKQLGISLGQTNSFSLSIMGLGMFFDDAQGTAEELASQLGGMDKAGFGLQLKTNLIASNLGISGGEAASLVGSFSRLNGGSTDVALNMMKSAKETARMAGVIPSKVMKDLAGSAEAFAVFGKQGGKNIAEAAVYASKLGVNMDTLTGVADKLLDFETSITEELELSAMLGRNINLDRARQLAYEGDIQGAVNETLNQLGGIEAFNQMDYYQKKQTAELLGVSVAELQQMAENQKNVNQEVSLMQKGFDTASSALEYFNSSLLGKTLNGLGTALIAVGQMGTGLSALGIDAKKIFGSLLSVVKAPFKLLSSTIKGAGSLLKSTFTGASSLISSMFKKDEDGKGFFARIKDGFKGVKDTISSISSSISGLFKKDEEGKGFFTRMKDGFKSVFGGGEKEQPITTPAATDSIGDSMKDTAAGGKELEQTKSMGDKLKDLAEGLSVMGTGKVLAGALNLIPTGIGFLLMLPGIPSLFLLSKIDVSKVGEGLGSLAEGLESMGTGKVLFGAINLIPAGIGFALMTLGFIGMGIIALLGIPLGAGLTAMAAGLTAMGNPAVFMGALGILAVGAALLPFTFALSLLQGVDVGVILATVGALVAFGFAAAAIGTVLPLIAMGALGIGLISLALIPFTFAISQLQGVDVGILFSTALALGVFGIAASVLGVLSPLILLGSVAIAALSLALIPFTFALSQLQGIDPSILLTTATSLGVFATIAAYMGIASPLIIAGATAIGYLGLALIPFTYALSQLQMVDPMVLVSTALALGVFGAITAGFGMLAPLIIAGSIAISILGLALIPFTYALSNLASIDVTVLDSIYSSMMGIAAASLSIAAGLAVATIALLALPLLFPGLLIASVVFGMFGSSLMLVAMSSAILAATLPTVTESLKQMIEFTDGIFGLSAAILALAGSLTTLSFASLIMVPLLPVIATIGAISSLFGGGGEGGEAGAEEGGTLSSLESTVREVNEALLMEIKGLRDDLNSGKISVNMDGDKVTSKIVTNINRSAANGYGIR